MRISIGADHRGVPLKAALQGLLAELGHEVKDLGTCSPEPAVDYPDIASSVAREVAEGRADRGVLVCGSGIGMAITANKIPGVRATVCADEATAEICRRHNDVNVLCISNSMLARPELRSMLETWLKTPFEGGRHSTRLQKIAALERSACGGAKSGS